MPRRYLVVRTDRTEKDFVLRELDEGRLRQGWGSAPKQDLVLLAQKRSMREPFDEEEAAAWRNRRLLPTQPNGVQPGDIVVVPNLPTQGRWVIARVTGGYRFEISELGERHLVGSHVHVAVLAVVLGLAFPERVERLRARERRLDARCSDLADVSQAQLATTAEDHTRGVHLVGLEHAVVEDGLLLRNELADDSRGASSTRWAVADFLYQQRSRAIVNCPRNQTRAHEVRAATRFLGKADRACRPAARKFAPAYS